MAKRNRFKKGAGNPAKKDISLIWRVGARGFAVSAIFATAMYGIIAGGHITDPNSVLYNVQGKVAGQFGYAAQDIRIAGLKTHSPASVLKAIRILPNDSLIGFNANAARSVLEKVDWVKKAEVRRIYPNQLEIDIVERLPFAIWQRDGEFYVIDKFGAAFTSLDTSDVKGLIVVTGEGAHKSVFDLVNYIEAHSGLKSKIVAAGRIGDRRWNLYLKNGLKVMLPEKDVARGLARLKNLQAELDIFNKAVGLVDLRLSDRVVISPLENVKKQVKVSQR